MSIKCCIDKDLAYRSIQISKLCLSFYLRLLSKTCCTLLKPTDHLNLYSAMTGELLEATIACSKINACVALLLALAYKALKR